MLLHKATLVASKEITLTHTSIFDNAPITLSATKEQKNTSNLKNIYSCKRFIMALFNKIGRSVDLLSTVL